MFDALPLAAEPYAAALDLVLSCVSANFARVPAIALLRSPHFDFVRLKPDTTDSPYADDVPALDRALGRGGLSRRCEALDRLLDVVARSRRRRAAGWSARSEPATCCST